MDQDTTRRQIAYEFVLQHVDSVPHLEALLLLWNTRPRTWSLQEIAQRLYVSEDAARTVLQDLNRQGLIERSEVHYCYHSTATGQDSVLQAVDETYRTETVSISSMIHSKASRAVRDFARAFRFTKERE